MTFVMDDNDPIIPTADDVARVAKYIEGHRDAVTNKWAGQPIGPEVLKFAPNPVPVDHVIKLVPNNATMQAAAVAAVQQYYTDNIAPGSTVIYSELSAAIADASGVTNSMLVSPSADVDCNDGDLLLPGAF